MSVIASTGVRIVTRKKTLKSSNDGIVLFRGDRDLLLNCRQLPESLYLEQYGAVASAYSSSTVMQVVYSDDCLLHNPPHEILSGKQVPYLESPARYLVIREALLQPALSDSSTPRFEFVKADSDSWSSSEVEKYILSVNAGD